MLFRCILIGRRFVAERRKVGSPLDSAVWNAVFATQPRVLIIGGAWLGT